MADDHDPSRQVSDFPSQRGGNSGAVQLSALGVRTIALYQRQAGLTDRLWAYFGTNSLVSVLVALVAAVLAQAGNLPRSPVFLGSLFVLLLCAYFAFAMGNRAAMSVSQAALERIAAQAQMASGVELRVIAPAKARFFHRAITVLTLLIMSVGFWTAYSSMD